MKRNPIAEKYFDMVAAQYDSSTGGEHAWTTPQEIALVISKLPQPTDSVLVVGIGTGHDIAGIIRRPALSVEGIDLSQEMLAVCARKYPWVLLHHGDFMTFSEFKRARYDLIICSGALEFIPEFEAFFTRIAALLATEGAVILTYEPIIYGHRWQKDSEADTLGEFAEKLDVRGFRTYRRTIQQFQDASKAAHLDVVEHYAFVAYEKDGVEIVYHLACAIHKRRRP